MILSVETQSDIRRLHDIFVARMAFEYRCEQIDVLSAIQPQLDPKQAAPSAATAPGGFHAEVSPASDTSETGGEEPSILPATLSQAKASEDGGANVIGESAQDDSVTGDASRASVGAGTDAPTQPEAANQVGTARAETALGLTDETGLRVEVPKPGKSVGASAPAAPAPHCELRKDRLIALNAAEPYLTRKGLAARLGVGIGYVNTAVNRYFLTVPNEPRRPAAPKPEPGAKAPTLADRIQAYLVEHPQATARELSDALGTGQTSIGWAAKKAGIKLRKYTSAERAAATSKGMRAKALAKAPAMDGGDIPLPSKPAIEVENEPLEAPRVVKRPKGERLRLRQKIGSGKYLHMGGEGLVDSKVYAWIGTATQLAALRAKFPAAVGMIDEVADA